MSTEQDTFGKAYIHRSGDYPKDKPVMISWTCCGHEEAPWFFDSYEDAHASRNHHQEIREAHNPDNHVMVGVISANPNYKKGVPND